MHSSVISLFLASRIRPCLLSTYFQRTVFLALHRKKVPFPNINVPFPWKRMLSLFPRQKSLSEDSIVCERKTSRVDGDCISQPFSHVASQWVASLEPHTSIALPCKILIDLA